MRVLAEIDMTRWLRELRVRFAGQALRRLGPALVFCALLLGGCDGCGQDESPDLPELPVPPDPGPTACEDPELTPIISVHEHIVAAPRDVSKVLAVADRVGVQKVNLLPFRNDAMHEQNITHAEAARAQPDRLSAFASLDATDPDAPRHLEQALAAGASGVKLYSGHAMYYEKGALVGEEAMRLYGIIEGKGLPLLMHVNGQKYEKELREILTAHPKLVMLCPHYCLLTTKPGRLNQLFRDFPNLYSDVSFGALPILMAGLQTITDHRDAMRAVIRTHRHRFAYGMDMSAGPNTEPDKLAKLVKAYREVLEEERYIFFDQIEHEGLDLDDCTLESIYRVNPERFLAGKPPLSN